MRESAPHRRDLAAHFADEPHRHRRFLHRRIFQPNTLGIESLAMFRFIC
jgi:hypothetical protein